MARRYYNREPEVQKRPVKEHSKVDYSGKAKELFVKVMALIFSLLKELLLALVKLIKCCFATKKRSLWVLGALLFCFLIVFIPKCSSDTEESGVDESVVVEQARLKPYYGDFQSNRQIGRAFNDLNDKHIVAAKANGVPITKAVLFVEELVSKYDLELIEDCRYYSVDKLTHSAPYLVQKGADLLMDICKNFRDSVESKGYPVVKPIITSIYRTPDGVKKLQRSGNVNSSSNSAHLYATTVDITYRRFDGCSLDNADVYKYIMAEVLRDLRKEGRCYVKFELKQACYHITVR